MTSPVRSRRPEVIAVAVAIVAVDGVAVQIEGDVVRSDNHAVVGAVDKIRMQSRVDGDRVATGQTPVRHPRGRRSAADDESELHQGQNSHKNEDTPHADSTFLAQVPAPIGRVLPVLPGPSVRGAWTEQAVRGCNGRWLGDRSGCRGLLLGVVPEAVLVPLLAMLLLYSAIKVWRHA